MWDQEYMSRALGSLSVRIDIIETSGRHTRRVDLEGCRGIIGPMNAFLPEVALQGNEVWFLDFVSKNFEPDGTLVVLNITD